MTGTPARSPEFKLLRTVAANDSGTITNKGRGMNMSGFRQACVQVVPSGGDNPAAEVMFWSEEAAAFVSRHTPLAFAGKGANISWDAIVQVDSEIIFVYVPSGAGAGATKIYLAGTD